MRPAQTVGRLCGWRLPQLESSPRAVAFARTWSGRVALLAFLAGMLKLHGMHSMLGTGGLWAWLTAAAAAVAWAGRYRLVVLLACTGAFLAYAPGWFNYEPVRLVIDQQGLYGDVDRWALRAGTLVACAVAAAAMLYFARRYRDHRLGRRPVLVQHLVFFLMFGIAVSNLLTGMPQVLLWSAIVVFSAYFWYLAYALIDQRRRHPLPPLLQLATFNAFSWSAFVPLGKGAASWRRVEAVNAEELAITQLKGLKLLVWAWLIAALLWGLQFVLYRKLGVPRLDDAFDGFLAGGRVTMPFGIISIVANFFEDLLVMALWGHLFVGVARFAGFRLLRNTWRPLSSRTLAEFWNRYNYYFKEAMVAVYFYPTYLRWFKSHPRLRLAFATLMAAGVGNFFFHFLMTKHNAVVLYGFTEALLRMQTYAFYCALLVAGIVASQLRARSDGAAGWLRGRLVPFLVVAGFYCFLSVFDNTLRDESIAQHFRFLFHMLGIDRVE
jgi:hypothetical protein